jgi:GR25 family glycosyltransferase involved in LPS biosynthesis
MNITMTRLLWFCVGLVLAMFIMVVILSVTILSVKRENNKLSVELRPFQAEIEQTNVLFTGSEDVDFIAIGMGHRVESHFNKLRDKLTSQGIKLQFFEGLNGKDLDMDNYNMTSRYRKFFTDNIIARESGKTSLDYRGHLGATVSHLTVIKNIERMTVILEDDADPVPGFRHKLQQTLADATKHDPTWEILVLGCSANYKDHYYHKLNDTEAIYPGGIVKLHYWIGGWGIVYKSKKVAEKIARFFDPMTWHVDLCIAEQARLGNLNVYGIIPTIVNHPGYLRISSFDFIQIGDVSLLRTDTNK